MNVTEFLDNNYNIAILGDRDTGKTNLLFWFAKNYKGKRKILTYAYPVNIGYDQIHSLSELAMTTDSIILMDELQRHIKIYNNQTNADFLELLSIMIHNNNTLIFSTPLTQSITKATDNFIDVFIYTKISDIGSLKNGSKAKRWLQDNSFIQVSKWSVNVEIGCFLVVSDSLKGYYEFDDMKIGKDWRQTLKKSQNFTKNIPKKKGETK